ncbi:VWA domain-containing protein [archaeon]|jgi:hypothetical protein|nr:VWA domain-containing protein [archaeon]MBT6762361.1 VWA domain-containing protein [archaeon]
MNYLPSLFLLYSASAADPYSAQSSAPLPTSNPYQITVPLNTSPLLDPSILDPFPIPFFYDTDLTPTPSPQPTSKYSFDESTITKNIFVAPSDYYSGCDIDLMFLVDRTGSMGSFENEVKTLVRYGSAYFFSSISGPRVALSAVHESPKYELVRDFTIDEFEIAVATYRLNFNGGGLMQEPYETALDQASRENWRHRANRLIVVFADEVPKGNQVLDLQAVVERSNESIIMVNYGGEKNFDVWANHTGARITSPTGFIATLDDVLMHLCFQPS